MAGGERKRRKASPGAAASLATTKQELCLDFTLPTGQSFRWRRTGENEYTGVVANRLVRVRQAEEDVIYTVLARGTDAKPSHDQAVLQDYFNLHTSLADLSVLWAEQDPRFRAVAPFFPGARVLRQDPLECLFQFVCSSNNHISRIHGMVERLCSRYGTPLHPTTLLAPATPPQESEEAASAKAGDGLAFFAFPTLSQLSGATDADLRADGFGYRAKFIVGSVAALQAKPEGGDAWLRSLRQMPYAEASAALCTLPGVGPKVAACVCLFALDKTEAIPVDTHVWQLATRYYAPKLKGKTLTPKLMIAVEAAFIERFGMHAGWAHNTLFISDLASQQHRLPPHLRSRPSKPPKDLDLAGASSDDTSEAVATSNVEVNGKSAVNTGSVPHASARDILDDSGKPKIIAAQRPVTTSRKLGKEAAKQPSDAVRRPRQARASKQKIKLSTEVTASEPSDPTMPANEMLPANGKQGNQGLTTAGAAAAGSRKSAGRRSAAASKEAAAACDKDLATETPAAAANGDAADGSMPAASQSTAEAACVPPSNSEYSPPEACNAPGENASLQPRQGPGILKKLRSDILDLPDPLKHVAPAVIARHPGKAAEDHSSDAPKSISDPSGSDNAAVGLDQAPPAAFKLNSDILQPGAASEPTASRQSGHQQDRTSSDPHVHSTGLHSEGFDRVNSGYVTAEDIHRKPKQPSRASASKGIGVITHSYRAVKTWSANAKNPAKT